MYELEFGVFGKCTKVKFLTFESALPIAKAMSLFAKSLDWRRTSLLIDSEEIYSDIYEEGLISIHKL